MCECSMMACGEFTPIRINENKLSFNYIDCKGVNHTLIKEFAMDIMISKASVVKITDKDGKAIAYEFRVE